MKPLRVHPLWIGSVLGFILLLIVCNCFVPNHAMPMFCCWVEIIVARKVEI